MTVGLLNVLGARYWPYWNTFLSELGVEVVTPGLPDAQAYALGRQSLPDVPAQVQLVLGRILELGNVDSVLLPRGRPVTQDAWSSDLADLLPRRLSGLPQLIALPDGGPEMPDAALELGQRLTRNPAQVRLALSKVKLLGQPPRQSMPGLSAASKTSVAVIGPDSVLRDPFFYGPLAARLAELGLYPIAASDLPREQVEERGQRSTTPGGKPLPVGERDLHGAQSLLEGKGAVRGLLYTAPARDAAMLGALNRLAAKAHKPTLVLSLDPDAPHWPDLERFAAQLTGTAPTSRPQETS
ncbi:hypothetical protein DKM44_09175 [Deinococcus irradiatisoli]|uniref:Uncharacterized protein n=1 Tax=Deinococcus irradiatisoli TaxID=2202254 RepID=A0A2Z3JKD8_9DEIO|nr:hypothetical protein [Deinococcus irradiatisoli]AWN23379.1 hypothetical protein DKM44_09175 [Deinococcus irradiatisoli]